MFASSHTPDTARHSKCLRSGIIAVIWFALVIGAASAAKPDPNDEFAIELWMTENGMPQNIVTALLQSREGYIWAETYNGIALFDGEIFRFFDSTHTPGLTNSRVTCLFEDHNGVVWIGHDTYHLTKFANGKFEPV